MTDQKYAAILGVYGKPADRFMPGGYKLASPDVYERMRTLARSGLVKGLELIEGPGNDLTRETYRDVHKAVQDLGLTVCAVNPNLWGEIQWAKGSLGSTNPEIRRQAIDRVKIAMDLAAEMNAPYVGLWPGQDGYDYLFEVDYLQLYENWVGAVQECADHNPAIQLGLEYKPYEPRTHSTIDTAPKTLLMLRDINRQNAGLTLDVGHAMYAHENLGEVVALAMRENKLFHLHLNDNYADWDWDLNFGAVHMLDFIEMIYWLKRTGYSGWYSVDIFAYRLSAADSVVESLEWLNTLQNLVESTGLEAFERLIAAGDPIETSRFFRKLLFSNK